MRRPLVARTLAFLPGSRRATRERLEAFQSAALRRVVTHAYETVPLYRRLYDAHGVHPRSIRSAADLSLLPTVDKAMLAGAEPRDLVPRGVDPARLISQATSGSTGRPLRVRRTWLEQSLRYLFWLRAYRDFGYRRGDRIARIRNTRAPDRNDNKMLRRLIRRLRLQPEIELSLQLPLDQIAERLRTFDPQVIRGYAGHLDRLGQFLGDRARECARPRFITTSAEVLLPHVRERIERTFDTRVFDLYGTAEFETVGWECPRTGELHLCEDSIVAEILRDGHDVARGEEGELVITSLHSYSMPFIRYRLGDVLMRGERSCRCGAPFATTRAVQGRVAEYFTLPDGRTIMPTLILFVGAFPAWIVRYQIWQTRPDHLVLLVEPRGEPDAAIVESLRAASERVLAPSATLEVRFVDAIPALPGGKQRVAIPYGSSPPSPELAALLESGAGQPSATARPGARASH